MAATINDVQAAVAQVQATVTQLSTDVQTLVSRGNVDLTPVVSALGALNTSLSDLDTAVQVALSA